MSNRNKAITIVVAAALLVALMLGALHFLRPSADESTPEPSPSVEVTSEEASPEPSPTETPFESDCTTTIDGFTPVRFTFEGGVTADESIYSLGQDAEGNVPAPPPADKRGGAWWNEGPEPGTPGKALLTIHTYRNGAALGNEMYIDGEGPAFKPGDLIKLYGEHGEVACFEFTHAKKIKVPEYDPDSDMMIDFEGDRELAIIICWDFDPTADEAGGEDPWRSRVFFYGKLV